MPAHPWSHLRRHPAHAAVLLLCVAGVVLHQWVHWGFTIDDAGICFAYARNVANGEGIVPWPGGERVEGISDPTWVALLTLFELVGISAEAVAKPLAMGFGALTVPVTWLVARQAMPTPAARDGAAPLFAPMALALSAQLAIWSASALENSLWCLLLAAAVAATVADGREGRFLRSALCWLAIAWSRPEGLIYAICGGFWYLVIVTQARRPLRPFYGWMVVFWLPTFLGEVARLWYFAWPLPNTWYAKLDTRPTFPLVWSQRGWEQVRSFGTRLWQVYYLPVYVVGLVGLRDRRWRVALAVVAVGALVLLYPTPEHLAALRGWPALPPLPGVWADRWLVLRIGLVVVATVALPLAALRTPGWEARVLCWHTAGIAVLFSVVANGDWMGGYRWMSLMVPSTAVLLAVGVEEIVARVERALGGSELAWGVAGWLVAAFAVCGLVPPNYAQSRDHAKFNGDESVPRLRLRAAYTGDIVARTFHRGPVYNLEMDMGGYLLDRPEFVEIDMAGLVDVPMSRHTYRQRDFVQEYVFDEHTPTFAHVHGWWAQFTDFQSYEAWADYVPLPGHEDIPPAPAWHDGMWAHRSLFSAASWEGTKLRVPFRTGLVLEGLDVPSEIWAQGKPGYVEMGFTSAARGDQPTAVAFLTDGSRVVASWGVALGYGLFGVEQWRDDVVLAKLALRVPGDVAKGRYDLGLVLFDGDGAVIEPVEPLPPGVVVGGAPGSPALLAKGEVRFPRAVKVAAPPDVEFLANSIKEEAVAAATSGHCEAAAARWIDAEEVRIGEAEWLESVERREIGPSLAGCWAQAAEAADDLDAAGAALGEAYRWDRDSAVLARVGGAVGAKLWAEGEAARASGDWETAYRRFTALLGFQPWRSWARRYAEEARNHRLGLER
ncbi:MAG: hypothetical protein R3F59_01880 [Myxococcota bacterium]